VAAVRILSLCSGLGSGSDTNAQQIAEPKPEPFSSLLSHYPKVYQSPEWRPHCADDKKSEVIRKITQHFQKEGYPCMTIDGVRIDFGDGAWAGVRQSNTSPKISVCIEAQSEKKLEEVEKIIKEHLARYPEIGVSP